MSADHAFIGSGSGCLFDLTPNSALATYCGKSKDEHVKPLEPDRGTWLEGMEFIRQAREAVGLFSGAMPITPQAAWEEALDRMRKLTQGRCWVCMERERKFSTAARVDPIQQDRSLAAPRLSSPSGFYMISELDGLDPEWGSDAQAVAMPYRRSSLVRVRRRLARLRPMWSL